MQRIIADPGCRAALVAVSGVNRCGQSHLCPSLPSRAPLIDRKLPTFKQIWTNAGRRKPGGAARASETGTAAPAESTNERGPPPIAGWAQDALGKILRSLWSAPVGALLFSGMAVNHTLDSVLAILGLGLTAVGILLPVIYSFRKEVKDDNAALRKEVKDANAALRKEFKDDNAALRKEVKDDNAALRKEVHEVGKKIDAAIDRLVEWRFEDRELVVTKMAELETSHNGQIAQVHARIDVIASNVLAGSLSNRSRTPSTSQPVGLEDPPAANA